MKINLNEIKSDIQKYAEVVKEIIGIDVEVMDTNFIRVAATGILKDKIDTSMQESAYVYKNTIETNKTNIVLNPREDIICESCNNKDNCIEEMEISLPIAIEDEVIGVIGLICFDKEKKEKFIEHQDKYVILIEHIREQIKSRLYEHYQKYLILEQNSILNRVFNKISQAVIIIDKENKILTANTRANAILGTRSGYGILEIKKVNNIESIDHLEEFVLVYNNLSYDVIGEIVEHPLDLNTIHKILIFREKKELANDKISNMLLENEMIVKNFIYKSDKMKAIDEHINKVSKSNSTVLITGESGTGKEIVARLIHYRSLRFDKPFIAINTAAIPETLLESELFGYAKGAFTGADTKGKAGKIELANGGVLFLDEIGDMPLNTQVKLLRVLQDKKVTRVGSNDLIKIDVRIIAATNKCLTKLIENGTFREDLYYRLNVIPINIPPLRERREDIKVLAYHFAKRYSALSNIYFSSIEQSAMSILENYKFYGNVRELENIIEYAFNHISSDGIIYKEYLPLNIHKNKHENIDDKLNNQREYRAIKDIEKEYIITLLKEHGTNLESKKKIANILGIGIATLYRKMENYGIEKKYNIL